jgi:excisionase family DNA binding protein
MELLTVREAARLLKLSKSQVYALCQRRAIPTIALGRSVRIPREELDRWLGQQIRPARAENDGLMLADDPSNPLGSFSAPLVDFIGQNGQASIEGRAAC